MADERPYVHSNSKTEHNLLDIHARALCAHAECLAFNAANMYAVTLDHTPPYDENHYYQALMRWGLLDEKYEPTFIK